MNEVVPPVRHLIWVTLSVSARQTHHAATNRIARVVSVAVLGLVTLAGCGSSKPAYCSARADLENSIKGVSSLSPSSPMSVLEAQFKKIQTDANAVVTQAKGDFPTETSAIKSSVEALTSAVNALKANPSASQIVTVTSAASNVVSSVKSFTDASSSKCS
jgi:hypothetical protein